MGNTYIRRELHSNLYSILGSDSPKGVILSGLVGCGKTTLIQKVLSELKGPVFHFTGDDIVFRQKVSEDSRYLSNYIKSQTTKRSIVFVDEVQKCDGVFDAIKIAFDEVKCNFVISGSNPAYLSTIAKKRLQRRADQLLMLPLSLKEIATSKGWYTGEVNFFHDFVLTENGLSNSKQIEATITPEMKKHIAVYFEFGGLPLAHLAKGPQEKLGEIRLTVERGFELLSEDNSNQNEIIRIELAKLQAQEFTYQNIFNKTRLRRRENVNAVIDDLINHGYLVRKKPSLLMNNKSSYFNVFSYVDPGIVSYLIGTTDTTDNLGHKIEGYIHSRLSFLSQNSVYKSQLGYFKNHELDSNKNIRYLPGEIDFIFESGSRVVPIEVKSTFTVDNIDSKFLQTFVTQKKLPYGVIIYGGAPFWNERKKILYWPYWLV